MLYPPKSFWEDIEFNRLCEERGLAVLKCNRFFHFKKNLQRRAGRLGAAPAGGSGPQCLVQVAVLPSAAGKGEAVLEVELRDDTNSYAAATHQILQALEAREPGCLIVHLKATPHGAAQAIELIPAPPPQSYLPLATAEAWLLPALSAADRIEHREGPSPELPERGPLAALRAWFASRGLDPEGGPGVFAWPPDGDEDEARPAYGLARGAQEFRKESLREGDGCGGECVVVLRAFRSDGRDGLEGLLHRFTNRGVQALVRVIERIFVVVPALLLAEGEPAAVPARVYIEKVVQPARAQGWQVGGVWTGRRSEGGCLPVFGEGGVGVMEDGCFLLVLLTRTLEAPVRAFTPNTAATPATPLSGGGGDAGAVLVPACSLPSCLCLKGQTWVWV